MQKKFLKNDIIPSCAAILIDTRIEKFNSAGVYVSQFGGPGVGNGQFYYPIVGAIH